MEHNKHGTQLLLVVLLLLVLLVLLVLRVLLVPLVLVGPFVQEVQAMYWSPAAL